MEDGPVGTGFFGDSVFDSGVREHLRDHVRLQLLRGVLQGLSQEFSLDAALVAERVGLDGRVVCADPDRLEGECWKGLGAYLLTAPEDCGVYVLGAPLTKIPLLQLFRSSLLVILPERRLSVGLFRATAPDFDMAERRFISSFVERALPLVQTVKA